MTYLDTINGICRQLESGRVPSMARDDAATILKAEPLSRLAQVKQMRETIAATMGGLEALDDDLQAERHRLEAVALLDRIGLTAS